MNEPVRVCENCFVKRNSSETSPSKPPFSSFVSGSMPPENLSMGTSYSTASPQGIVDADLDLAIKLSLQESSSHPQGQSMQPSKTTQASNDPDLELAIKLSLEESKRESQLHNNNSIDSEDPILAAVISASLKEANAPKSYNNGSGSPSSASSGSISLPLQRNSSFEEIDKRNIISFYEIMKQKQSSNENFIRVQSEFRPLHSEMLTLQNKLKRELEEVTKENGMNCLEIHI